MELRIEGLSQVVSQRSARFGQRFSYRPAGMYGLLGPNGAGKSTLMRTTATLAGARYRQILLGDIDVLRQKQELAKPWDICRRSLSLSPDVGPRHVESPWRCSRESSTPSSARRCGGPA